MSKVNNPDHYGGADNPYEAIKVIEAWGLGFHLGNAVKYIARAGKKDPQAYREDLEKAKWYLERALQIGAGQEDVSVIREAINKATSGERIPKVGELCKINGLSYRVCGSFRDRHFNAISLGDHDSLWNVPFSEFNPLYNEQPAEPTPGI